MRPQFRMAVRRLGVSYRACVMVACDMRVSVQARLFSTRASALFRPLSNAGPCPTRTSILLHAAVIRTSCLISSLLQYLERKLGNKSFSRDEMLIHMMGITV